ncbi:MAG: nucleoside hydrolase [Erysipelotrichaceae bacterium]|nr:nucleoside hydrolase [Erysipelotrichaceae bacterium]
MINIVIDTDPGHDDILASLVALAHKEAFNILGFTTVCGNHLVDKVTKNLLNVLDYLNIDIPVYVGASKPLKRMPEPQGIVHGESGLDGPVFAECHKKASDISAVDFLYDKLKDNKLTIVALAPLTNIAELLSKHPECKDNIEQIVLMGGSVYSGNIQVKSEFNIYHDPEAAKIVFNSKVPIVMAPIEVCFAGGLNLSYIERFNKQNKVSKLVYNMLNYYSLYSLMHHMEDAIIYDMTTIIYLLHPEYFTIKKYNVDIELDGQYTRGMTVCEDIKDDSIINNPIDVLMDVDKEKFINVFFDAIDYLDKQY